MPKGNFETNLAFRSEESSERSLDSEDNGTCQNPLFVSNMLNTFAPDS